MTNRRLMRRVATSALFVCSLLVAGRAAAQVVPPEDTRVEFNVNFWKPEQDLTIERVRFDEPLGIENKWFTEVRAMVRPGRKHKIRFAYVPIHYSDDGKLVETTFVFRGQTYTVNLPVNYEFKWEMYRFSYEWDALAFSHGYIGLVVDYRYNRVHAAIASLGNAVSTDSLAEVPLPTIGGIARGYLGDYFSVTGEITGLDIHHDRNRGKFYDYDFYGQLNFTRGVAAQFGYRRLDTEYRWNGDEGDLLVDGFYLGGTVRF